MPRPYAMSVLCKHAPRAYVLSNMYESKKNEAFSSLLIAFMYNLGMDTRRETHHRQSTRLPHYDYSQPGAYFVTLVTCDRACLFGEVRDGVVWLSVMGQIVDRAWRAIPEHFPGVVAAEYVVMPNHVHGVVVIQDENVNAVCDVGATYMSPLRDINVSPTLGVIIGTFKAAVTREIHKIKGYEHLRIWQRNYHERVIRDERDYEELANYIVANPLNWELDSEFPSAKQ